MELYIITIGLILFAVLGITIKIWAKKDGEFAGTCASQSPFLNKKGDQIFNEIFEIQKKRIYTALLNSSSEEVINFDNVLKKIING